MMKVIGNIFLIAMLIFFTGSSFAVRDPTRPPDSLLKRQQEEAAEKNPFIVNAIIISKERRLAVINGITLQLNDTIENAKVIKIEADHVCLKTGGVIVTVPIFKQDTVGIPGK